MIRTARGQWPSGQSLLQDPVPLISKKSVGASKWRPPQLSQLAGCPPCLCGCGKPQTLDPISGASETKTSNLVLCTALDIAAMQSHVQRKQGSTTTLTPTPSHAAGRVAGSSPKADLSGAQHWGDAPPPSSPTRHAPVMALPSVGTW